MDRIDLAAICVVTFILTSIFLIHYDENVTTEVRIIYAYINIVLGLLLGYYLLYRLRLDARQVNQISN